MWDYNPWPNLDKWLENTHKITYQLFHNLDRKVCERQWQNKVLYFFLTLCLNSSIFTYYTNAKFDDCVKNPFCILVGFGLWGYKKEYDKLVEEKSWAPWKRSKLEDCLSRGTVSYDENRRS